MGFGKVSQPSPRWGGGGIKAPVAAYPTTLPRSAASPFAASRRKKALELSEREASTATPSSKSTSTVKRGCIVSESFTGHLSTDADGTSKAQIRTRNTTYHGGCI